MLQGVEVSVEVTETKELDAGDLFESLTVDGSWRRKKRRELILVRI